MKTDTSPSEVYPLHNFLVSDQCREVKPSPFPTEPDTVLMNVICLEDAKFDPHRFRFGWETSKTLASALNRFAGRTIEKVEYQPLPFDPQTNPIGSLGAFVVHFLPMEDTKS